MLWNTGLIRGWRRISLRVKCLREAGVTRGSEAVTVTEAVIEGEVGTEDVQWIEGEVEVARSWVRDHSCENN